MKNIASIVLVLFSTHLAFAKEAIPDRLIGLAQRSSAIIHIRVTFSEGKSPTRQIVQKVSIIDTWKKDRGLIGDMTFKTAFSAFSLGQPFSVGIGNQFIKDFIVFSGTDSSEDPARLWHEELPINEGKLLFSSHYYPLDQVKRVVVQNAG
jgi:hypothetical protein